MALETLERSFSESRDLVRRKFAMTHNAFLTLNQALATAGPCFYAYLPAWRRDRDAWARFYSQGWSAGRDPERLRHLSRILYWRKKLFSVCGRAARDVPLYAAL